MENEKILAALVAGLALNELLHIVFEIWGIRQKVSWLTARMDSKPHGAWPLNIDTLAKTLLLHSLMFIVFSGFSFALFSYLNLSIETSLQLSILFLVFTYSFTVFGMDAFHGDIGKLISRYKKL